MKNLSNNRKAILVQTLSNVKGDQGYKFLEGLNRKPKESHIKSLVNSFNEVGTDGVIIKVIRTKAFCGKIEQVLADGQHSYIACIRLNVSFTVQIFEMEEDSKENIRNYIALLNNVKRGWSNEIYLTSYSDDNNATEYKVFERVMSESGLKITDMLYIFLGSAGNKENYMFKKGNLTFLNYDDSMELLNATLKVLKVIPNKAFTRRSLYKVMRVAKNYDKLANAIVKTSEELKSLNAKFSENETEFLNHITRIYQSEFKVKN